jgi:hypothetical protein
LAPAEKAYEFGKDPLVVNSAVAAVTLMKTSIDSSKIAMDRA